MGGEWSVDPEKLNSLPAQHSEGSRKWDPRVFAAVENPVQLAIPEVKPARVNLQLRNGEQTWYPRKMYPGENAHQSQNLQATVFVPSAGSRWGQRVNWTLNSHCLDSWCRLALQVAFLKSSWPSLGWASGQSRIGKATVELLSVLIVLWQCKARLGTLAVFSQLPHCHRHHSPIIPEKPLPKSLPECLPSELCVKTGCNCSKVLPYMCSCEKHEEVLCPGV